MESNSQLLPPAVLTPSYQEQWRKEPLLMQQAVWPKVQFYSKQIEIIYSVRDNVETYVPAGNMLGKDFVAGFIALWFFIAHYRMDRSRQWVRVVTTSVKDDHLRVLWSEIAKYTASASVPLLQEDGGPLVMNHHEIRHHSERNLKNPINYLLGCVSSKGEGMQGHHAENTLLIVDEASGVDDTVYDMATTWAKRILIIGNPLPCSNFFYKGVKGGDMLRKV